MTSFFVPPPPPPPSLPLPPHPQQQHRQLPSFVQSDSTARNPRYSPTILASPTTSSNYSHNLYYARRPPLADIDTSGTMPRPNPPPTPGSSSDIRGKDGASTAPTFHLPPTAYQDAERNSTSSATPSANGSDSSYRPASPTSPADLSRKRSAAQASGPVITKDDFTLPPPPTRSRKIIQMKPRDSNGSEQQQQQQQQQPQAQHHQQQQELPNAPPAASPQILARTQSAPQNGGAAGKKKQNSTGTTAAGRKIARKTAHSLIERRRRSKMNEEFGVLKDMIPACRGQEMHKLAILQASIEYLRYLEQCVSDLQSQNITGSTRPQHSSPAAPGHRAAQDDNDEELDDEAEEEDEDEEMADDPGETAASTPVTHHSSTFDHHRNNNTNTNNSHNINNSSSNISLPSLSQITTNASTNSPSVFSTAGGRHYSISSAASQASYSPYFHSTQTSPAFGPQLSAPHSAGAVFGLGSPALKPLDSSHQFQPQQLRQIAEGATAELSSEKQSALHATQQGQHARTTPPRNGSGSSGSSANGHQTNGNGNGHANGSHGHRRSEHELDHEASAALLMLNHDRRSWVAGESGGGKSDKSAGRRGTASAGGNAGAASSGSGGMSVKDLLSG